MSAAEREVHHRLTEAAESRLLAMYNAQPVACHVWLVTAAVAAQAAAARTCANIRESERLGLMALAFWQEGRCAMCGGRDVLVKDHDHTTGLVRRMLCESCNMSEGNDYYAGSPFARYRKSNPASILGLRIRYWSPFSGYAEPESVSG